MEIDSDFIDKLKNLIPLIHPMTAAKMAADGKDVEEFKQKVQEKINEYAETAKSIKNTDMAISWFNIKAREASKELINNESI